MCITLGYRLYKKNQAKKAAAGPNPGEKDYAPKPHAEHAASQTTYPPTANDGLGQGRQVNAGQGVEGTLSR